SLIKFHLVAEDQVLYPRLARSGVPEVEQLSTRYQQVMEGLAEAFRTFVAKWRVLARLEADPEGFRRDANTVLKAPFARLQRANRELYPAAEQLGHTIAYVAVEWGGFACPRTAPGKDHTCRTLARARRRPSCCRTHSRL